MAPALVPSPTCPVCGGADAVERFTLTDRAHGVAGRYRYVTCGACGTVRQAPRVADEALADVYPAPYLDAHPRPAPSAGTSGRGGWRGALRKRIRDAVQGRTAGWGRVLSRFRGLRERAFGGVAPDELLPHRDAPGRALDLGCGLGNQMAVLAGLGWHVEGVEWDARSARVAREVTGRPVHVGDVRDLALPDGSFDLVLLHHVVEHLADPGAVLAAVHRLLTPGGRVVLVYPNPGALAARLFGPAWMGWDAPRHLVLPPVGALGPLAERAGLVVTRCRTTARNARSHLAHSRRMARRTGVADDPTADAPATDRLLAGVERTLVAFGVPWGEEVIAVLEPGGARP